MPIGWSRFALGNLAGTPWRNGGGVTREIASGRLVTQSLAADAPELTQWDWRVSVADIVEEGPFSTFIDIDRQAALAGGHALQLRSDTAILQFDAPGDMHRFPGEVGFTSRLAAGPVQLFNLMTRRGVAAAALDVVHDATSVEVQGDCAAVVLTVRGAFQATVQGSDGGTGIVQLLRQGDGISIALGTCGKIHLQRLTADGCLLTANVSAA